MQPHIELAHIHIRLVVNVPIPILAKLGAAGCPPCDGDEVPERVHTLVPRICTTVVVVVVVRSSSESQLGVCVVQSAVSALAVSVITCIAESHHHFRQMADGRWVLPREEDGLIFLASCHSPRVQRSNGSSLVQITMSTCPQPSPKLAWMLEPPTANLNSRQLRYCRYRRLGRNNNPVMGVIASESRCPMSRAPRSTPVAVVVAVAG